MVSDWSGHWFQKLKRWVQYYIFDLLRHCVSNSVLTRLEARCHLCLGWQNISLFVKTLLTLGENLISDENAGEMLWQFGGNLFYGWDQETRLSVDSPLFSSIGQGTPCRTAPSSPCLSLRTCSRCHDFHLVYSIYDLVVDLLGDT